MRYSKQSLIELMPLIISTSTQWSHIRKISFVFSSRNLHQAWKQSKLKSNVNTTNLPKNQVYKILLNGQTNGSLCFRK